MFCKTYTTEKHRHVRDDGEANDTMVVEWGKDLRCFSTLFYHEDWNGRESRLPVVAAKKLVED